MRESQDNKKTPGKRNAGGSKPTGGGKSYQRGSKSERSGSDRSKPSRSSSDRSSSDRGRSSRSSSDHSSSDRSKPGRSSSERYSSDRNKSDRSSSERYSSNRSKPDRSKSVRSKKGKGPSVKKDTETTRINKFIAAAGICSRREADELIKAGLVSINGVVVTELGTQVKFDDEVKYNGEKLGNERKVYILLNKPKDYVTTVEDAHAKKTVMELISKACKERVYPVGRLDKNTTGVLLFTNDGDLTKKLTHPSLNKKKIYHAHLDKNLTHSDMQKISEGVSLSDGIIQVDAIAYASQENKREVGLELHSGKNRIVRRVFENMGYKVLKLDRVYFAGLTKKNLPRGRWRFLSEKEVQMLKMNAFE